MTDRNHPPFAENDRIELTRMDHDPDPIPVGSRGTVVMVVWAVDRWQVVVKWDISRSLNLAMPPDEAVKIGVAS